MKIENTKVFGINEDMIEGVRHAWESYERADSEFGVEFYDDTESLRKFLPGKTIEIYNRRPQRSGNRYERVREIVDYAAIGPNDMQMMKGLARRGGCHRKFLRQIFVTCRISAPIYWWKEMDTYKVGTVRLSNGTMHTLKSTPITFERFEHDDYVTVDEDLAKDWTNLIDTLERLRTTYLATKDIHYWKELIRMLPESWIQTSQFSLNYENLVGICAKDQRRNHKLTEWKTTFIDWARSLPFAQELIFIDEE